jgi:hypothetical protein
LSKKILVVSLVVVLVVVATVTAITVFKNPAKPVLKRLPPLTNEVSNNSSPNNSTGIANPTQEDTPVDAPVVDIKADTELIKLALVEKDKIDLSQVDVVVTKDTGKYAEGGITPKQEAAGGGYFFAAKTATGWKIVASGNGTISCDSLKPYPDFPVDMISECVDPVTGNPVQR